MLILVPSAIVTIVASSNPWFSGQFLSDHYQDILAATDQHVILTAIAVAIGFVIALPLGVLAHRRRFLQTPLLGVTGAMYAFPSLALFIALVPATGLSRVTVEIGLVSYTLLILLRNILAGLADVPDEVKEAARGMGYGPLRLLLRVELPLAVPAIIAGLRVATVSTIALVTVGAVVGYGGLGNFILEGFTNFYHAEVMTATLACIVLALIADLLFVVVQWAVTPWRRR